MKQAGVEISGRRFSLAGADLMALGSGALWWPEQETLVVSDLHLGKAARIARLGGAHLPPYEVVDTLDRLSADIAVSGARRVICLGDSFDDLAAAADVSEVVSDWMLQHQAGRDWVWIEGNHDPGPVDLGGAHLAELALGPLVFRHIAVAGAQGEVSGHYHPKARIAGAARRCFLVDAARLILPAYGTYTGGLWSDDPVLAGLMGPRAVAILTGPVPRAIPMPRDVKRGR